MAGQLQKDRLRVITVGGTSTAYGTVYGTKPIIGEIKRVDWSGTGLGVSGYFILAESGAIHGGTVGASQFGGTMDWQDSVVPYLKAKAGSNMLVELTQGSAFVPYVSTTVPYLVVSGCNAGSLFLDVVYEELR